jgi:hypothetical protein
MWCYSEIKEGVFVFVGYLMPNLNVGVGVGRIVNPAIRIVIVIILRDFVRGDDFSSFTGFGRVGIPLVYFTFGSIQTVPQESNGRWTLIVLELK